MTITASIPTIQRHEVSMARSGRARGIDRAVVSLAVAMLNWSRAREARAIVDHAEYSRRRQLLNSQQQREIGALRLSQHIGF